MNPQEASKRPALILSITFSSFDNHEFLAGVLNVESRIPADVIHQLGSPVTS